MNIFHIRNAVIAAALILLSLIAIVWLLISGNQKTNENTMNSTSNQTELSSTAESMTAVKTTNEQLQTMVKEMTLDQKIGQLFLARTPDINQIEDIKTYHLGGYLLFGRDIEGETRDSFKNKLTSFRQASELPFLIAADEEGGLVTRISRNPNLTNETFKSPQQLFNEGGFEKIVQDTDSKSTILNELGINAGLYPVADVSTNQASFIYDRTLGQGVGETSEYITQVVEELTKKNSGSTLKHFPGYGDNQDSHVDIVRDNRSLDEIKKESLPPFEAGIKAGADSILVSHNIVDAVDNQAPASISPEIHRMIREDLQFDGVIMTDDMDMAGLSDFISQEKAGLAALQSGNDLILSSTYSTQIPVIKNAVLQGEYSEDRLDESVLRILIWKHKLGLISLE